MPEGPSSNLGSAAAGLGRPPDQRGRQRDRRRTSVILMIVIGIFIAAEPRLYDRGIAWMLPVRHRDGFYQIAEQVGFTLRRLLFGRLVGMIFEGVFT